MRSSRTITLFTERPEPSQKPSSFVASILVHAFVVGLVALGFMYAPQVTLRPVDPFMMRRVDLNRPDLPMMRRSGGSGSMYPTAQSAANSAAANARQAAPSSSRVQFANRKLSLQTLVQPDIAPIQMVTKETPLPALLLWSPPKPTVKTITPPPPHAPASADVHPTLDAPNPELNLADIAISSTAIQSATQLTLPSTTSPVAVHQTAPVKRVPETTSVSSSQPTSAAVLSASDLRMTQGTVVLPHANESAPGTAQGALGTGRTANSLQAGKGDATSSGTDTGAGKSQGTTGAQTAGTGKAGAQQGSGKASTHQGTTGSNPGAVQGLSHTAGTGTSPSAGQSVGQGAGQGTSQISTQGDALGNDRSVERITLPKNGQFGVVVVGSSMGEQYPEATPIWSGRLAYSVYLHVGTAKSWILQYSLPRAADSANAGAASRLEAPWPYYIVRPNLDPDRVDFDAVMVHGFVNEAGHFDTLSVIFPSGFTQAQFVLGALQQWQFRSGTQNGQITRLEVLLIIPVVAE